MAKITWSQGQENQESSNNKNGHTITTENDNTE